MKFLKDLDLLGKRVLIRVDFNVALDDQGNITDDTKILATQPTLQYVLDHGAKQIILMSHLGRPKGKVVPTLKMDNVAKRLGEVLQQEVVKLDDCINVQAPENARVVLLENVRFHDEEQKNDEEFAKKLASHGDVYVNDAFGSCHDSDTSLTLVPKFLPGVAGLLLEKEIKYLTLKNPERPFVAILGGAKISTKFDLIRNLLNTVDKVYLGGAMIFTFYKAKGWEIGKSLYEADQIEKAKFLLNNEKIMLPEDVVVAKEINADVETKTVLADRIPVDCIGLDLGPDSMDDLDLLLKGAKTIIWNGPLGYYEIPAFAKATDFLVQAMEESSAVTIAGGGETGDAIAKFGDPSRFTHVSTGGGASMALLSGKEMPGFIALEESEKMYFK